MFITLTFLRRFLNVATSFFSVYFVFWATTSFIKCLETFLFRLLDLFLFFATQLLFRWFWRPFFSLHDLHDFVQEDRILIINISLPIKPWPTAVPVSALRRELLVRHRSRAVNSWLDLGKMFYQLPLSLRLNQHACEISTVIDFIFL